MFYFFYTNFHLYKQITFVVHLLSISLLDDRQWIATDTLELYIYIYNITFNYKTESEKKQDKNLSYPTPQQFSKRR